MFFVLNPVAPFALCYYVAVLHFILCSTACFHVIKMLCSLMMFPAEFVLNPAGKSHICVLHEYAQHAMRIQPRYIFEELGLSLFHASAVKT